MLRQESWLKLENKYKMEDVYNNNGKHVQCNVQEPSVLVEDVNTNMENITWEGM